MRYLSIDLGVKRIGLAICDAGEAIVSPLAVIESHKGLIGKIKAAVKDYGVGAVVLGLPLNMDGSEGTASKSVRQFAEQMKKTIEIPVYFQDERLSTFGAAEKLAAGEFTHKGKKKRLDAIAAAEILQAFLDSGRKQDPILVK